MAYKVCAEPGCPKLQPQTRCPEHTRAQDKARGTRQQRGYDAHYDRARRDYQRRMASGETFVCWRCEADGRPHDVDPNAFDLGHDDNNRNVIRGPECRAGNRATTGRR